MRTLATAILAKADEREFLLQPEKEGNLKKSSESVSTIADDQRQFAGTNTNNHYMAMPI